jgi:hypothetical protein
MMISKTTAKEVTLLPLITNNRDGALILESLPSKIISSLSVSEFKWNGSCKSGKDILDWMSPPVAHGGGSLDNAAPSL